MMACPQWHTFSTKATPPNSVGLRGPFLFKIPRHDSCSLAVLGLSSGNHQQTALPGGKVKRDSKVERREVEVDEDRAGV